MEAILLGAEAYVCDEHDFVANKRKVLLLGLRLMLAILTVEVIEFKQRSNYNRVGYETVLAKLHLGSREQASLLLDFSPEFYLFHINQCSVLQHISQ